MIELIISLVLLSGDVTTVRTEDAQITFYQEARVDYFEAHPTLAASQAAADRDCSDAEVSYSERHVSPHTGEVFWTVTCEY